MENYTLIGHPLGHSMSPFIHNRLFALAGRPANYTCSDIAPENLRYNIKELNALNGYNITIPHKVSIIPYIDKLDTSARRYNSVNCVHTYNGETIGYNTDCDGFLRSVSDFPLSENVLLLGCGGVGRMMAIEASLNKANLTIAIIPEAQNMAKSLIEEISVVSPATKIQIVDINQISGKFDLLINATPVGMYPKSDACPVSREVIENCDYFFDAIYNPIKTNLITTAAEMGKKARGGMAMLVLQAVKAHEIWNNDTYTEEQIQSIISDAEKIVEADFR